LCQQQKQAVKMLGCYASKLLSTIRYEPIKKAGVIGAKLVNQSSSHASNQIIRSSSTGPITDETYIEDNLKLDIKESSEVTHIEAIPVDTGRGKNLLKLNADSQACALCRLNLRNLNYTDVMILSQFIKRNGSIVTYHESKLCTKQYLKVVGLIKKAQRCNLIRRPADYLVPGPWHDLNTYLEPDRKRDQPMKVIKKEYWRI
jgi:ribosomal protein S18